MQKIVTFLWFDNQAEEAVNLYVSLFKNSKILDIAYYEEEQEEVTGMKAGNVMSINFELEGQKFSALNGGPYFSFTPAISLFVNCDNQAEVDVLWEKLSEGGEKGRCGWLKDRFGISWQIIPTILGELLNDPDKDKAKKVITAMLKMGKIDTETLKIAYNEK